MNHVISFIPENQLSFINDLANSDDEVIKIKQWINELPDLSEKEIESKIIDNQMRNIEMSGFENWNSNAELSDNRITPEMISSLRGWAVSNNLMTIEAIIENHKKKASPK